MQVNEDQSTESPRPALVKCAKTVTVWERGWGNTHQCSRKAGFGADGKFCKQHDDTPKEPTETWYRTEKWGFEIETVAVISATDKTLVIKYDFQSRPSRTARVSEYYHYWPTREEAVEFLRKRVDRMREDLLKAEREFQRTSEVKGTSPTR